MKRTRLGNGRKSLERGSTFDGRGEGLRRVTPLRSAPKPPANPALAALDRRLAMLFHDSVQQRRCPICREPADYLHAHHCIDAHFLDTELRELVTPERLIGIRWDLRNALGACGTCHMNDHWSMWRRIARTHIREAAWEFAAELDALVGDQRFTVRLESYPEELKEIA